MDPEVEPVVETAEVVADPTGGDTSASTDTPQGNPAWEPFRKELDPISFSRVEKHLKEWDTAANQRVTSVNEQYKWAKDLQDRQIAPERINLALQFADNLDKNPEMVYEQLTSFLRENGRLPESKQELQQAVAEEAPADSEYGDDPRLKALQERQNALDQQQADFEDRQQEQWDQIQQQELTKKYDAELSTELSNLEATRTDLSKPDIGEILTYAARQTEANRAQGTDKIVTLSEATAWFDGLRTRFLTAPRPGDSAPDLLPTSGGNPGSAVGKSPSQMSSDEIQAFVAAGLTASRDR
jgi:hypothetical protein